MSPEDKSMENLNNSTLPAGTVTFLFTDIQGSTLLLEQLRQDYTQLLEGHHKIQRAAIARWDGHEIDTQGDSFFVSFTRATDALNCVIEAQRALAEHTWPRDVEVRVRMGLHTGEPWQAVEGYVGMDVHRAARIAHTGHGGQVLLSETTAALVRDELPPGVELKDLGRHLLKDMRSPEHIRQLVIPGLPAEYPPLNSLGLVPETLPEPIFSPLALEIQEILDLTETERPVFVARQAELERLDKALQSALVGELGLTFVTGGPGRGKSALLAEFTRQALASHPDLLVVKANCNAYSGVGDPFLPFRQMLSQLVGFFEPGSAAESITPEGARRLWEATPLALQALVERGCDLFDALIPGSEALQRATQAGLVQSPLGLQLEELVDHARTTPGEQAARQGYTKFLRGLAEKRPLLLLLDDLQWADSASIDLFFHMGRELVGAPLLLLAAYRPEEVAAGRGGQRHPLEKPLAEFKRQFGDIWIDLTQTDQTSGRVFIDQFLDSQPNQLPESFRQALFGHTGGHPLFTVELLRALQERGDLYQDEAGFWQQGSSLDWDSLPARIEGVIEERIGRLESELRQILTVASVEGQDFTAQVLARVQGVNERGLVRHLSGELAKVHRLVGESGVQEVFGRRLYRYHFLHHLFQKYLYNDIGQIEREMLHQEVAEALEFLYGDQNEQIAAQLAWHYEAAGESEKAIEYLLSAGDQARLLYATTESVDFYQRAIKLLKEIQDYERSARTLMKLGLTYHTAFHFRQAQGAYEESIHISERSHKTQLQSKTTPGNQTYRELFSYRGDLVIDPAYHDPRSNTPFLKHILFSGLVTISTDYSVAPCVAKSWQISPDGRKYIFHLRDDVYWSDGFPVTAHDFEFAWKRILNPTTNSPHSENFYPIKGGRSFHQGLTSVDSVAVKALDKLTLSVKLEEPTAYWLYFLAHDSSLPVPKHQVETYGDAWTDADNLVSNDAFILDDWISDVKMVFKRYPAYHEHFTGNLDQLVIYFDPGFEQTFESILDRYQRNELDYLHLGRCPSELIADTRQIFSEEYFSYPDWHSQFMEFNTNSAPFNDLRVRRAFGLAIDRAGLCAAATAGSQIPATGGFIPPGLPGHIPDIALPYDPAAARRLLAEAGYPDGYKFPAIKLAGFITQSIQEFLFHELRDNLGVEFDQKVLDWDSDMTRISVDDYHMIIYGWWADYPDPDSFLRVCLDGHKFGWKNESYERLVTLARQVLDQEQRFKYYAEAERILVAEAPLIPLWYTWTHILLKPWVKGFNARNAALTLWKDVYIEPH